MTFLTSTSPATASSAASEWPGGLPRWPLAMAFAWYPLWWLTGVSWLAFAGASACMVLPLLFIGRSIKIPGGFGLWLLLLFGSVAALLGVSASGDLLDWGYHAIGYYAGAIVFVYAYNMPAQAGMGLSRYLVWFWCIAIVGGVLGVVMPGASITTPLQSVVSTDGFLGTISSAKFSDISSTFGVPRPSAPFLYANKWGAIVAITTPAALTVAIRSRGRSRWLFVIAAAGLVPVVYSLNRTLWAALVLLTGYAVLRAIRRGRTGILILVASSCILAALVLISTPMFDLLIAKFGVTESGEARSQVYAATWESFKQSPIIGHGGFNASETGSMGDLQAPIGTQGQLWSLMYSGGLLMLLPYYLWFFHVLWRTRSASSSLAAAYRAAITVGIGLSVVYALSPDAIPVLMLCCALLIREGEPLGRRAA